MRGKKKKKKSIKQVWNHMKKDLFVDKSSKNSFSIIEVIIIILISILFGIVIGYLLTFRKDAFSTILMNENTKEIVQTYHDIIHNYYDDVDSNELKDAAIKGMVESLHDPYSVYMDEHSTSSFMDTVDGSFVGIGVVIQFESPYNRIIEIMENSPASKAGLMVDDLITKVDGQDVKDFSGADLTPLIRGEDGAKVSITVLRNDTEKTFEVIRGTVELQSVTSTIFEEDSTIGYISIQSFSTNTTSQFEKELKSLEKKNIDALILDVRGNPGGHLLQTREILSMFFPKKTVLYQIESKDRNQKIYSSSKEKREYPIAVLIDSSSASAAEIFASCFQENYKNAIIVGYSSYGKGTVQKTQKLTGGTSIKYTTQKWLTSKGEWLAGRGVIPDVIVSQTDDYYKNPSYESDVILQKALELLKESM